jgi:hypothetical protein
MTEIVEYSLVVIVSTLFVAGSVLTYDSFSSFVSELQVRTEFASVTTLASQAMSNGSSRATLTLPSSVITCSGGSLTVSSGTAAEWGTLPVGCGFAVQVAAGAHVVRFTRSPSGLALSVS